MIAVAWSALGILAVAVFGVLAVMVSQSGQLRSEMGQLRSELNARIDAQTARIDALTTTVADLRVAVQTLGDRVNALEHHQPV